MEIIFFQKDTFLVEYLPAHIMLPPKRLETLLSQAIELQQVRCKYHVKTTPLTLNDISLLKDHSCSKFVDEKQTKHIKLIVNNTYIHLENQFTVLLFKP